MGNRVKEDDRIEKIIRGLLKLPENRRCINCNSLGPQYVCTTFLTYVCTNCSGVHREFTHRVKSVSMAKFSAEEVSALQVGGNDRARQIYFRGWDSQRHSFPDGSNLHKLREFIKHVYVDRKYASERSTGLPRLTLSGKGELNESRRLDAYHSRSRSPCDEDKYGRFFTERSSPSEKNDNRYGKYYYDERSPRYSRENSRHGGYKQSPVRFEIVDDRFRDDRFGSHRFSPGDSMLQSRLRNSYKNVERSCSPVARPVEEGDSVPTLQVDKVLKDNNGEHADGFPHNQESADVKPVEHSKVNLQSLIDFSETEARDAASTSQTEEMSSINGSNPASVRSSADQNSSQAPKVNTLESLLFGLSVHSVVPVDDVSEESGRDVLTTVPGDNNPAAGVALPAPSQQIPELIERVIVVPMQPSIDNIIEATSNSGIVQQHLPLPSPAEGGGQQTTLSIGLPNNESAVSSLAHNAQAPSGICAEQSSQSVSRTVQDTSIRVGSQTLQVESKPSGRMELPADLFTASYPSIATPVSCWQTSPRYGMGFNHYPNTMPVPAFPSPAKPINPFDIKDERSQFPSVGSLQGALPSVLSAPKGLLPAFSLGPYSSQLMAPSSASASSPCTYMGQQVHNNVQPTRPQGIGGFESNGAVFDGMNTCQQPISGYSAPATTKTSSVVGNPFE